MLDPACFQRINDMWVPHTFDRFASMMTNQLPRFSSKYLNPGCDSTDAFTVSWGVENNWIFPPPYLIPRVLRHMQAGTERGTLIVPHWPSAPWWPLLVNRTSLWNSFVKDCLDVPTYEGMFMHGSVSSTVFTCGVPSFGVNALKVDFT